MAAYGITVERVMSDKACCYRPSNTYRDSRRSAQP